jgi:predicted nucleic acid-binding protein
MPSTPSEPTVIVTDASVIVTALADDSAEGDRVRDRLGGQAIAAPELIDIEVASALRRRVRSGALAAQRAESALVDLVTATITRASHKPLLARCWELRDNLTVYDAAYVALAEQLAADLLTADGRLARAPGIRCRVEVL